MARVIWFTKINNGILNPRIRKIWKSAEPKTTALKRQISDADHNGKIGVFLNKIKTSTILILGFENLVENAAKSTKKIGIFSGQIVD